jgi:DNA-binding response OmpR family regulator
MSSAKVLLIGRNNAKSEPLITALEKRYQVLLTLSGKQAVITAKVQAPHVVVLDAISMRTPGDRVCQLLRQQLPKLPIIHLHPCPDNTSSSEADVILCHPFTSRKLINSIERLLKISGDEVITCGPFSMNVNRRLLNAHGQETPLTPKQALLIETFLRHPNETLDRKTLMEKVWDTDYMGDTRTLDVHIRWIRRILENDSTPQYLKTVRGVGYMLNISD